MEKPIQESDAEKLLRSEMGETRGGEDAHHRTRGCDAEEDGDGAQLPAALAHIVGMRSI